MAQKRNLGLGAASLWPASHPQAKGSGPVVTVQFNSAEPRVAEGYFSLGDTDAPKGRDSAASSRMLKSAS